jgi:lipoprotein-anchoring transpeptidase ErfK/SrfK
MPFSNRRWLLVALLACIPIIAALVSVPRIVEHFRPVASMRLLVDLSDRRLSVIENGKVVRTYGVAVGTRKHPTPTGRFWTGRIDWNPRWVPPPREWARKYRPRAAGDPRNPMQGVKIYFREPWYFIHGTNAPGSIGTAASHGCLRMRAGDAKSLARRISKHGSVILDIRR